MSSAKIIEFKPREVTADDIWNAIADIVRRLEEKNDEDIQR